MWRLSETQQGVEMSPGMQIFSIASLFGVRAQKSSNADRFHERFHLTELVAQSNAGILTRHGDMLVCFAAYVTALLHLCRMRL